MSQCEFLRAIARAPFWSLCPTQRPPNFRENPKLGRSTAGRSSGEEKRDPDMRKVKELEERLAAIQAQAAVAAAKKTLTIEEISKGQLPVCRQPWRLSR